MLLKLAFVAVFVAGYFYGTAEAFGCAMFLLGAAVLLCFHYKV